MYGLTGVPPEIVKAAKAQAEELWSALDMSDSVDLSLVKPRVIQTLVLAYCHGALVVAQAGVETLNRAQRRAKGDRRPIN
jgi:hypothetical protein